MSVEQTDVVDIISTNESGQIVLTISDPLDWSNSIEHQTTLQTKFNRYLAFVESGEILMRYPDAKGRAVIIKVVFKYAPDEEGSQFLIRARKVIESAGFSFQHELYGESARH